MGHWRVTGAMAVVLLFGATALVQAQGRGNGRDEGHQRGDQARQARPNEGRPNGRDFAQFQQGRMARNGAARRAPMQARQEPQRMPQQVQRDQRQRGDQQAQQRQFWAQHRLAEGDMPENWGDRGGYQGRRIPTADYDRDFGYRHRFHMYDRPFELVGGEPRFQMDGFWFGLADPVPAYWGPDWYRNDDVYVVYAYGGYYLDNARFPDRPGIAISVVF